MALQTLNGVWSPHPASGVDVVYGAGAFDSFILDATAEKLAFIFPVPKTGNIDKVGFLTGTVTTGDTLKVSVQDVSLTDGHPDGTAAVYRTIAIADTDDDTWKETGSLTTDGTDTGTQLAVTRGDLLSIVIEYNSYVAGNLSIKGLATGSRTNIIARQYIDHYTTAWTKSQQTVPLFSLQYDDGNFYYIPEVLPVSEITSPTFNSGSTPDEKALKFSYPFPVRVWGAWWAADMDADGDIVLYDGDTNPSISIDKDRTYTTLGGLCAAPFASDVSLAKDTTYYLAMQPTTTSNLSIPIMTFNTAALLDQTDGGQAFCYAERTDGGGWTTVTNQRPLMGLILNGFDDAISSGGSGGGVSKSRVVNAGGI